MFKRSSTTALILQKSMPSHPGTEASGIWSKLRIQTAKAVLN
ncbi:hypothetical protein P4284_08655 [Bacillus swezeyi]|nr:hypothetical protein [Bacillus swezeyi]